MRNYLLLPDISRPGKTGCKLPNTDVPSYPNPPGELLRDDLGLPELSETDVTRYFTALSHLNYGIDNGFYPLGSCTMKYNPRINEDVARLPGFSSVHPLQPTSSIQGILQLLYEMQGFLSEITGMDSTSLVPLAGAQGELAGLKMLKAYFLERSGQNRHKVLITDSAHGTNAASASMCGFEVDTVPSNSKGNLDIQALISKMDENVAALTLTIPNTLGLFDPNILEINRIVHEKGALLGGDGANLNAVLGKVKFGEIGFDYVQVNLHKTFGAPHGGGGPGSGPVCVKNILADYLPSPLVTMVNNDYSLTLPPKSIGRIANFYGNIGVIIKAYVYIRVLGAEGLKEASEKAVLNANYLKEKLKAYYNLPYNRTCMHEVVFSGKPFKKKGVSTMDISKRIIDYGMHPPTVYFPLIVEEALMIEPTETESKETLDHFVEVMKTIAQEIETDPEVLHTAPHHAPSRRLDEVKAVRQLDLGWHMNTQKT